MISATLRLKDGDEFTVNKVCFGFMSDIDCFHDYALDSDYDGEDCDIWDEDLEEWVSNPESTDVVYGKQITTNDLSALVFHSKAFQGMGIEVDLARNDRVMKALKEAVVGLPQYYDNIEINGEDFTFPLEGVNMQKTIIGAMMIRNILHFSVTMLAFDHLISKNVEPKLAFILSQRYNMSLGNMGREWVFYPTQGGDEAIFCDHAKVCDIVGMYSGKIGFLYQGNWGDTRDGYGRYGSYGSNRAEINPRTNITSKLTATTMILENDESSQNLYKLEQEFSNSNSSLSKDQLESLVAFYIKEISVATTVTTKES